ncbi:MAG: F0F1 ATP synthase subunit A [Butyrivibrio sp.]|nr:F0F1 ATP synthase subunit A [Butyrivibrio sp.]
MDIGKLLEEILLEDKVMIHLPFGNGFFDINQSVVYTWFVIIFLLLICIILTTGMRTHNPGKRQLIAEFIVSFFRKMTGEMLGEEGKIYSEFIITVLIYIGTSNLVGLLGKKPPTMDLNVTLALSLMSIFLIEFAGIRKKGGKKWIKSFAQPMWVVTPMNILEVAIKPLSLCMRLFGNVIGATVIMELIRMAVPLIVPVVFSLYFDIFDGLIQAYVFVFLTSLYIKEAVED